MERTVSLEGIPEPVARAIEMMAEAARNRERRKTQADRAPIELPVWHLGIQGKLRREDYYE